MPPPRGKPAPEQFNVGDMEVDGYGGASEVEEAEAENPATLIEMRLTDAIGICEEVLRVQRSPMLSRVWTKLMEAQDWLQRVGDL